MHSVIQDIIRSTEERVRHIESLREDKRPYQEKRDIVTAIDRKREEGMVAVIAEVKPASPRRKLRDISPADAGTIARQMEKAGAVAISVLTEPQFFMGSLNNLLSVRKSVNIPVLRKDFIINEVQTEEVDTDMILLIVGVLGEHTREMAKLALDKKMEPLVEIHNEVELDLALKTDARMIGINNRDLNTLETDIGTTLRLAPIIRKYDADNGTRHFIISESGIISTDDVRKVMKAGADGILVGTSIIESGDVYEKTKELVEALK